MASRTGVRRRASAGEPRITVAGSVDVHNAQWLKAEAKRRDIPVSQILDELLDDAEVRAKSAAQPAAPNETGTDA